MAKITLRAWAALQFNPPPCAETQRRWVRAGLIFPPPVLVGREYRVEPDARYISPGDPVLGEIIHGTKSKKGRERNAA